MNSSPHLKHFISLGIFVVAIGFVLLGTSVSETLMWIGFVLAVIASIISFTIRCPHCGCHLVRRGSFWIPNYCPSCGEKISGNEYEE